MPIKPKLQTEIQDYLGHIQSIICLAQHYVKVCSQHNETIDADALESALDLAGKEMMFTQELVGYDCFREPETTH